MIMTNLDIWQSIVMITVRAFDSSLRLLIQLLLVLRVYDRGMDPPKSELRLVHSLKGFKNKNWPIKSSFYCGSGCKPYAIYNNGD